MNAPAFTSILDRPSNTIEKPKPLPVGTYLWMTVGQPKEDKSAKKGTPYVEFLCKCLQAGEDVDAQALQEALTNKNTGDVKPLTEVQLKLTFYLTEASAWRLTEFLDHLVGEDSQDQSPRQRISASPGRQFLGNIIHEQSDDGKSIFAKIGQTAPVEQ